MTAADVLLALIEADIVLWVDGDRLRFRAPRGALTDELRRAVDGCRGALLVLVKAGAVLPPRRVAWPADEVERFEERAGICEVDARLPRLEAELRAERLVRLAQARRFVERAALRAAP